MDPTNPIWLCSPESVSIQMCWNIQGVIFKLTKFTFAAILFGLRLFFENCIKNCATFIWHIFLTRKIQKVNHPVLNLRRKLIKVLITNTFQIKRFKKKNNMQKFLFKSNIKVFNDSLIFIYTFYCSRYKLTSI